MGLSCTLILGKLIYINYQQYIISYYVYFKINHDTLQLQLSILSIILCQYRTCIYSISCYLFIKLFITKIVYQMYLLIIFY